MLKAFETIGGRNVFARRLGTRLFDALMLVIRRKVTRERSFTVLMLPGYYREWPTSDWQHREILKLFKQDRGYEGIVNDFSEFDLRNCFSD